MKDCCTTTHTHTHLFICIYIYVYMYNEYLIEILIKENEETMLEKIMRK